MGSALLAGWLAGGVDAQAVSVLDPFPSDWLKSQKGVRVNDALPKAPAVVVIAVKPQMMGEGLPQISAMASPDTLFLSIAAGTRLALFEQEFGTTTPIIRAMPNTPAAIGRGISAIIGNKATRDAHLTLAEALLCAVGQVVRLQSEDQMDAVTAVSGSGPAYVFHLMETLATAGEAEGLPPEMALNLARATVAGAGALAEASEETPGQLRVNVTSPGGTTAAALDVLMDEDRGFPALVKAAVQAAAKRGKELGG